MPWLSLVVNGGYDNFAAGYATVVGGGISNTANGHYSTVSSGFVLSITCQGKPFAGCVCRVGLVFCESWDGSHFLLIYSHFLNRYTNNAFGYGSVVVGGHYNNVGSIVDDAVLNITLATGAYGFVGAGWGNTAQGHYTSVVGGNSNTARGSYSNIAGGTQTLRMATQPQLAEAM